jgi:hypothetical protein
MTDKLRQAAEMALEALEFSQKMGRSYEIREYHNEIAPQAMYALRQELAEQDTGIDRGLWSDVPDATKWVDELRGDDDLEEPPNSTTDVVEPREVAVIGNWGRVEWREGVFPQIGDKMYAAPPKREWQGLTDEEIQELRQQNWQEMWIYTAFARAIEAKLREKNHV